MVGFDNFQAFRKLDAVITIIEALCKVYGFSKKECNRPIHPSKQQRCQVTVLKVLNSEFLYVKRTLNLKNQKNRDGFWSEMRM